MKSEDHIRSFNESLDVIKESIEKGIQKRQRSIGFCASTGAIDLFEIFLHNKQLLNPSSMIKHDWFSSERRINERLNFDFPKKNEIINLILKIEAKRNILCYGKLQPEEYIEEEINDFFKLIKIFRDEGLDLREDKE